MPPSCAGDAFRIVRLPAAARHACQLALHAHITAFLPNTPQITLRTHRPPRSWEARLHDMQTGAVTGLAMAYDDSALISASQDGCLMVVSNPLKQGSGGGQPGLAAALPAMSAAGVPAAEDLADGALSFEQSKQAAMADAVAAQAARARQGLRGEFDALRGELESLLAANNSAPAGHKLQRSAFTIDPGEPRRGPEMVLGASAQGYANISVCCSYADVDVAALAHQQACSPGRCAVGGAALPSIVTPHPMNGLHHSTGIVS